MEIIGFTGPASSGKTTLAKALRDYLTENGHQVRFLTGVVRSVLNDLNITLKDVRKSSEEYTKFQKLCLSKHLLMELMLTKITSDKIDYVITDRTWYDYWIYTLLFTNIDDFATFAKDQHNWHFVDYDYIFYTKPLDIYDEDGIRDKTDYNLEVLLYDKLVRPVVTEVLPPVSLEERLDLVLRSLGV